MQDMQTGIQAGSQFNRLGRALVAGLLATDLTMERDIQILAIQVRIILDITPDHLLFLRVDGDQHTGLAEDTLQRVFLVHQHISRRRAEEEFQSRHTATIQFTDFIHIVVRPAEEEGIVSNRHFSSPLQFPFQIGKSCRLRLRIRHIHEGSHPTSYGSTAFAGDIAFMRQSRFTEMHLIVDHAGQHPLSPGVDRFAFETVVRICAPADLGDPFAADDYVSFETLPVTEDRPSANQQPPAHTAFGLIERKRSFSTPKKASRKIPPLIFDAPSVRSVKMIGTSLTRNSFSHCVKPMLHTL